MTWIADIGDYLETNNIGTVGTTIFINKFDKATPNCISIFTAPGLEEKVTLRRTYVLSRPELDIRVRNADDSTAEVTAKSIQDLLSLVIMQTIGSTSFKNIRPLQDYFFLEQDENDRFVYAVNFKIEINNG